MKKYRSFLIAIVFILSIIIVGVVYIAVTECGIRYKSVYSKHIEEDLSTLDQKDSK